MICSITRISETNYRYFLHVLPENYVELAEEENVLLFGIESFGAAAGAIMVRIVSRDAEIIWFYVDMDHRGRGIGSEGLFKLMQLMSSDYGMSTISMNIFAGSDTALKGLFDGLPVQRESLPQKIYTTTLGFLLSSPKLSRGSKSCISLADLDSKGLNNLCSELIRRGEDLVEMPIVPDNYLKNQSAVYMEDGIAKGVMLLKKQDEGIAISLLASFASNVTAIMDMMSFCAEKSGRFDSATKVTAALVDERMESLIRKLLSLEDDEDFDKSERVSLDLSYFEIAEREAQRMIELWKLLDGEIA